MDINNIQMIGIEKDTPIEIREKVTFGNHIRDALKIFKGKGINEVVILSTCHRSEVYFYSGEVEIEEAKEFFKKYFNIGKIVDPYIYSIKGNDVIEHIFRVACGLESMVVGEDQILVQVKDAIEIAQDEKTSGKILNKLFRDAVTLAKKARSETGINDLALSISYIAVKFIQEVFEDIKGKDAFVIGTGEMGQLAIKNLIAKDVNVYVTNRTHYRAVDLKNEIPEIEVVPYEEKYKRIAISDIVISATDAPHYTIEYHRFKEVYCNKKICMVDIALPRDIDPEISSIKGVSLYTLDDLKKTAEINKNKRIGLISIIERMIDDSIKEFNDWFRTLLIEPYIKEINTFAQSVCKTEFERVANKLKNVSENDRKNIQISLKRVADKMCNVMIRHLKSDVLNDCNGEIVFDIMKEGDGHKKA